MYFTLDTFRSGAKWLKCLSFYICVALPFVVILILSYIINISSDILRSTFIATSPTSVIDWPYIGSSSLWEMFRGTQGANKHTSSTSHFSQETSFSAWGRLTHSRRAAGGNSNGDRWPSEMLGNYAKGNLFCLQFKARAFLSYVRFAKHLCEKYLAWYPLQTNLVNDYHIHSWWNSVKVKKLICFIYCPTLK